MKSVERTFSFFDEDQKGYLTRHQAKCAILYLNGEVPATLPLKEVCKSQGGRLSLELFKEVCARLPKQTEAERTAEVFRGMDVTGQGFVTRGDFDVVCEKYAKFLTPSARRDLFAELDSNTDGRVTLRDLARCLSYSL